MSTQTADFYNRFSFLYPLVDVFLKPQKRALFNEINNLPHGKLLEIGVGNGAHLNGYKKHHITGIDTSAAMLEQARRQHSTDSVKLIVMNGEALSFDDGAFDYVVLSHVIAVVDDPERLLREVHRVLKPNGRIFILNHFTPDNWMRYIDKAFALFGKLFHFQSVFRYQELNTLHKFSLQKEVSVSIGAYFKLLIYQK